MTVHQLMNVSILLELLLTSVTFVTPSEAQSGSCTSIFLHSSITEAKQDRTSTDECEYFTRAVTYISDFCHPK